MNSLLVLDDEQVFANFIAKIGKSMGFNADACCSVSNFRKKVEWEWPGVLVLDLQMPETDGIELLREISNRHCSSKIILASGVDGRVLDSAYRLGDEIGLSMFGKIQKPIRANDLKKILAPLCSDRTKPSADMLKSALEKNQIFLLYQPKIDLVSKQIVGVEALARWRDDDGRIIMPDNFIPMAESTGLIEHLTPRVIDLAIDQAEDWHLKGLPLNIAINLSAKNIRERHLPDILHKKCDEAGIKTSTITLELTETASMLDFSLLLEMFGRFRLKGFKLSIDDFGTGYSSAAQLLKLPFTEIKVDKSFVSQMDQSYESSIVAKTIIDMAHNLGLTAVAEGVETKQVSDRLEEWCCETAQGYMYSHPIEPEEIEDMIQHPHWMETTSD